MSGVPTTPAVDSGYFGRSPQTPEQKARRRAGRRLNRKFRHELKGTSGTLANGVRWWLTVPGPRQNRNRDSLVLEFSDPRANGIQASGRMMNKLIKEKIEQHYLGQLEEFVRVLELRQLEPADPGDPSGFFVKWKRKSHKRQPGKSA